MPGWGWKWGWQGSGLGGPNYYADPSSLSGVVAWYHMDENATHAHIQVDDYGESLGSELGANGDFADWTAGNPDDWSANNAATAEETGDAYGGTGSSCKLTLTSAYGTIYEVCDVTAGRAYKLTCAYKNTGGDTARLSVFDNSNSTWIWAYNGAATALPSSTSWTTADARYFMAPHGCSAVRVYVYGTASGDVVWFDDVSLKEVTAGNPLAINGSMNSSDLVTGAYGNGQDFDGSDDYLSQYSYEDEEGGSWGPTVHGISLADGSAFFNCSGVDLSGFAGVEGTSSAYMLVLKDNDGNPAWGYIGNADAAEAVGEELITNGGFDSDTTGWSAGSSADLTSESGGQSGNCLQVANPGIGGYGYAYQGITTTAGKLYKLTLYHKNGDTTGLCRTGAEAGAQDIFSETCSDAGAWGAATYYFTAEASTTYLSLFVSNNNPGQTTLWDTISCKEVTDVGATGVHIVSGEGSSTRNWFSVDESFDYNDPDGYTFDVYGTDFQLNGDISVGAWVRPMDGQPQGGSQAIASKGDPSGVNCETGWNIELSSDGSYLVTLSHDGSTTVTRQSSTTESDGEKESFALVGFSFDSSGQTLNFYYNGSADNGTLTGSVPATLNLVWDPLKVGSNILTQYFDGDIDEVFICSTALSAVEWAALYAGVG